MTPLELVKSKVQEACSDILTCKFCTTPARFYGDICPQCKPIYEAGERAGKNFVVKELRLLKDIEIK